MTCRTLTSCLKISSHFFSGLERWQWSSLKGGLALRAVCQPTPQAHYSCPFGRFGVDMTRLESRPSRNTKWSYVFFIDMQGHVQDSSVANVLEVLSSEAAELKVLGSYPRAVL